MSRDKLVQSFSALALTIERTADSGSPAVVVGKEEQDVRPARARTPVQRNIATISRGLRIVECSEFALNKMRGVQPRLHGQWSLVNGPAWKGSKAVGHKRSRSHCPRLHGPKLLQSKRCMRAPGLQQCHVR